MLNQKDTLKLLKHFQNNKITKIHDITIEDCQDILFKIENFKKTLEFVICNEIAKNYPECNYNDIVLKIINALDFLPKKERFKSSYTIIKSGYLWYLEDGKFIFINSKESQLCQINKIH